MVVARLGDAAAACPTAARGFAWHQAQVGHQLPWIGETGELVAVRDFTALADDVGGARTG
jgi:hypothetical protein